MDPNPFQDADWPALRQPFPLDLHKSIPKDSWSDPSLDDVLFGPELTADGMSHNRSDGWTDSGLAARAMAQMPKHPEKLRTKDCRSVRVLMVDGAETDRAVADLQGRWEPTPAVRVDCEHAIGLHRDLHLPTPAALADYVSWLRQGDVHAVAHKLGKPLLKALFAAARGIRCAGVEAPAAGNCTLCEPADGPTASA